MISRQRLIVVRLATVLVVSLAAVALWPRTAAAVGGPGCNWHSNGTAYWYAVFAPGPVPPATHDQGVKADRNGDLTVCQLYDGTNWTSRLHDNTK
jgi:hypothetical protein